MNPTSRNIRRRTTRSASLVVPSPEVRWWGQSVRRTSSGFRRLSDCTFNSLRRNRTSATIATTAQCQTDFFQGSTPVRLRSKACRWHPFVALVGPPLRVQFPPQEPNECNERWWRRWELNPRPQRLRIMRYVRLPGTPRRVSLCLSSAVIQVINTTMRSPDLPLIAAEP